MARPQKNIVDYFPHSVGHGKKMYIIEKKYGNDGYAVWFKILEELGNTEYHYLNLADDVQIMYLADRCIVSEELLIEIIETLIRLREFNKGLWESSRILYNEKFVESIKDAYKKRKNECINESSLLTLLLSLGILKHSKSILKPSISNSEVPLKPQTKLEETKSDYTTLNKTIENSHLSEIDISDVPDELKYYFEIATLFQTLFIKNLTSLKSPVDKIEKAKFKAFVDPIRLAFERDGITRGEIKDAYDYLDSSQGKFWWPNIQSTKKLREKIPQLVAQKNSQQSQKSKSKENGNTNPNNSEFPRGFKYFEQNTGAIEAV